MCMYLAIRSDKSTAKVYILTADGEIAAKKVWEADRELARDLPGVIDDLVKNDYTKLTGVIVYRGPGSFTGLRIGANVANAISYAQDIPIVGTSGDDWLMEGVKHLGAGQNDRIALPEYGAAPHITPPKK